MEPPFEFIQRIPAKLRWPLIIFCLAVFDAAVEMALTGASPTGLLGAIRTVLEAIPTSVLVAFGLGALLPYVWEERKRWFAAIVRWKTVFLRPWHTPPIISDKVGSPTVTLQAPHKPATAAPAATPPRALSTYEREQGLIVADQALSLVNEAQELITFTSDTQLKALNAFGKRPELEVHIFDLGRCWNAVDAFHTKVTAFCDSNPQHASVVHQVQLMLGPIWNLAVAIERFREVLLLLIKWLKDSASGGVFEVLSKPIQAELGGRLNYLTDHKNKTRSAVLALRQEMSR